jgi:hypothetical protein
MFRTFWILTLTLWPLASAQAGTIAYNLIINSRGATAVSPTRSAYIQLRERSTETIVADWIIPDIEPGLTPRTWSLTAADNHPGWAMFVEATQNHPGDYEWRTALTAGVPSGPFSQWDTQANWDACLEQTHQRNCFPWVEVNELQRIDFTLKHWVVGVSQSNVLTVAGEGRIVPEPASVLLLLVGLCHISRRIRNVR